MAVYIGVNGAVRALKYMDVGTHGGNMSVPIVKCGINGVVRNLIDAVDQIDYVAVVLNDLSVDTINSSGDVQRTDGTDLATLRRYGSLSVGSSYFQVSCTSALKQLVVYYDIYIVYKDGLRNSIAFSYATEGISYTLSVTGYEYFSSTGWYQNYCLGTHIVNGQVTDSTTATKSISNMPSEGIGWIKSALRDSGTCTGKQTFNSMTINGRSFSIRVINELT